MIFNIYFSFQQTQTEFKKIILFFRNFDRKYKEKKNWQNKPNNSFELMRH